MSGMFGGNEVQGIDHSHHPPADAASPEVGRVPRLGIGPALTAALVPGVVVEACLGVEGVLVAEAELAYSLVYPFIFGKLGAKLCQEGGTHIESVQPYLVLVDELVPVGSLQGAGMHLHLVYQHIHGFLVFGFARLAVEVEEHLAGVDVVDVVGRFVVEVNLSLLIDDGVAPLAYIVEVAALAGGFPHLQHGAATHSLRIAEEEAFAMIQLVGLGEALHLRVGKAAGIAVGGRFYRCLCLQGQAPAQQEQGSQSFVKKIFHGQLSFVVYVATKVRIIFQASLPLLMVLLRDLRFSACRSGTDDVCQDRACTTYEALHGNDHQDEAHEAHHDVVSRLAQYADQSGRGTQDEVGDEVYQGDGPYQDALHFEGVGILHQHDGVGNGTRAAQHGDAQRGDGDVVSVCLDFLVVQLHGGVAGLQHVEAYLEDDEATRNAEPVGGDAEEHEEELAGKGEDHDGDEGYQRGSPHDAAALPFVHALGHGEEHRHGAQGIGQGEKRGEAQECKGE